MIWLISEILLPIIVAGLLGLGFGIWVANRYFDRKVQERDAQIARLKLERDNAAANRPGTGGHVEVAPVRQPAKDETSKPKPIKLDDDRLKPRMEPTLANGSAAPEVAGIKPDGLPNPVDGKPDDLKEITGVGPKIEQSLHELGIYHYDQVARWSEANAAWVDDMLKFKGRVAREKWVEQAQELAGGKDG